MKSLGDFARYHTTQFDFNSRMVRTCLQVHNTIISLFSLFPQVFAQVCRKSRECAVTTQKCHVDSLIRHLRSFKTLISHRPPVDLAEVIRQQSLLIQCL